MADLFAKVNCTYCQEEINGVRLQCCACNDFDICLQCFCSGAEIGPHKNDHPYKFVDHCDVSIFGGKGTWTGREELQLLEGMEYCGFGNWEFVSQYVQNRTPEEVKEEYVARYLDGNIGKATWGQIADKRPKLSDDVPEDTGPLSPSGSARLPPLDATPEEARELNYMFHRDDYEWEYDMAAEQLVSQLQYKPGDSDVSALLTKVDTYTKRLRERARRKRLVRDYQLVAKFFATRRGEDPNKRLSKEQHDFRDHMRVFSQFLTSGEHERLIASIERERELRHRLSELVRYRSLGLTTQEDVIHYEQHVAFQQQQQRRQNKTGSSGDTASLVEPQLKNGKSEEDPNSTGERFTSPIDVQPESSCSIGNNSTDENVTKPVLPLSQHLSQNEIQLCTSLNILPVQYIIMKSVIINDHLMTNGKNKSTEDKPRGEATTIEDVVTEYLSYSGWLPRLST